MSKTCARCRRMFWDQSRKFCAWCVLERIERRQAYRLKVFKAGKA